MNMQKTDTPDEILQYYADEIRKKINIRNPYFNGVLVFILHKRLKKLLFFAYRDYLMLID